MFSLQVLSPTGSIYNDEVDEVVLPSASGEITILANHVPLFSKLTEGQMTVGKNGKKIVIALTGGFLEVNKEKVVVLSDHAVLAENIQVAQALAAKKRAEELLSKKASEIDMLIATRDLQKSILELKISEKAKRHL